MEAFNKKLKPCPFCGGKTVFYAIRGDSSSYSVRFCFEVRCDDCRASLPDTYYVSFEMKEDGDIEISNDGRMEAVEKWNKRIKKKGAAQDEQA